MNERDHFERARGLRQDGRVAEAAEQYAASAFGYLMGFRKVEESGISPTNLGYFARNLFLGGLCFRIVGEDRRAERHAEVGITMVEDIRESVPEFLEPDPAAPRGFCYELIGDFRTVGRVGDASEAYRSAEAHYREVENQHQWSVEPEFELQILTLFDLVDSADCDLSDDRRGEIRYKSLTDRIAFKRERLAEVVESVVAAGNWESDVR